VNQDHGPIERLDAAIGDMLLERARAARRAGRNDQALEDLLQAAARHPGRAETWAQAGEGLYQAGRYAEARDTLTHALELSPDRPPWHFLIARSLLAMHEFQSALDHLRRCVDLDPGHRRALAELETLNEALAASPPRESVAVVELLYHCDYLITLSHILRERRDVCLVLSRQSAAVLRDKYGFDSAAFPALVLDTLDWHSVYRFLAEHRVSRVFVNTIQGYELTLAFTEFAPPAPFHVTIHSFEHWLGLEPPDDVAGRPDRARAHEIYKQACRRIIANSSGVISICESIRDKVAPAIPDRPVHVLPWLINRTAPDLQPPDPTGHRTFTVPGGIERKRRNYGVVLETFAALADEGAGVSLVLLGRPVGPYGSAVIDKAREINSRAGRRLVTFFEDYVHQDVYQQHLVASDFILLPQANLDIFGRTKASAALYDGIIGGRPVLVPEEMEFSRAFAETYGPGIVVYDDLLTSVQELLAMDNGGYQALAEAARRNAARFMIDRQVERVEEQFFSEVACAR
jgi:tetratricopeptide (TPR) repeat protein